eukprot:SAG25_NODE_626_length_6357_cov_26.486737_2_plen_157_part_00
MTRHARCRGTATAPLKPRWQSSRSTGAHGAAVPLAALYRDTVAVHVTIYIGNPSRAAGARPALSSHLATSQQHSMSPEFRPPLLFHPNFGLSSFSINPADQSRMHSVRSILQPQSYSRPGAPERRPHRCRRPAERGCRLPQAHRATGTSTPGGMTG